MNMLIDTHCHLNDERLYPKADELVTKAINAGVGKMFVVGYDQPSSLLAIELAERHREVYAIIGVHPTETDEGTDYSFLEKYGAHQRVVAIGETGLDHYWHKEERQHRIQRQAFLDQIDIANRLGKPIVVHSRDAMMATLEILRANKPSHGGVMHCYSGPKELVNDFIELGMYISLGGPVTFLNARVPKEVAAAVPAARLLIETDSPYLAPHPHRGQQNEPSLLPLIAKAIAAIRGVSISEIERMTTENANALFHVKHE